MLVVGLTGGVGSGKSTVAEMFESFGAVIIDADVISREVVEPGTDGFETVVARFGHDILTDSGAIDRSKLAAVVFNDPVARRSLEEIVHPRVREEVQRRLVELSETDAVVVLVVPLLVESGQYRVDRTVVVDCEEDVAVERLVANRGWSENQSRQRIAAQISRAERVAAADYVIDNGADVDDLGDAAERCWEYLTSS